MCYAEVPGFLNQVDSWGTDGEILQVMMPSEDEVSSLVSESEKQYNIRMGNTALIKLLQVFYFFLSLISSLFFSLFLSFFIFCSPSTLASSVGEFRWYK